MKIIYITCAGFLLLAVSFVSGSEAFTIPERLVYDISWGGIKAGTATQEIIRKGEIIHIVSTARSVGWISTFFEVDDRIESVMTNGTLGIPFGLPATYSEKVHEGPTRRHKVVTFNHRQQQAVIDDLLAKNKVNFPITPITYDSLSCFYYARLQKLEPGTSFFVDIFDGKRLHNTEVKVLRRETVKTALGKFKTVLIMPIMKTEGIFSKTGDIHIWLTDDERRIPIKMRSKVKIGSISATLVGGNY